MQQITITNLPATLTIDEAFDEGGPIMTIQTFDENQEKDNSTCLITNMQGAGVVKMVDDGRYASNCK